MSNTQYSHLFFSVIEITLSGVIISLKLKYSNGTY